MRITENSNTKKKTDFAPCRALTPVYPVVVKVTAHDGRSERAGRIHRCARDQNAFNDKFITKWGEKEITSRTRETRARHVREKTENAFLNKWVVKNLKNT